MSSPQPSLLARGMRWFKIPGPHSLRHPRSLTTPGDGQTPSLADNLGGVAHTALASCGAESRSRRADIEGDGFCKSLSRDSELRADPPVTLERRAVIVHARPRLTSDVCSSFSTKFGFASLDTLRPSTFNASSRNLSQITLPYLQSFAPFVLDGSRRAASDASFLPGFPQTHPGPAAFHSPAQQHSEDSTFLPSAAVYPAGGIRASHVDEFRTLQLRGSLPSLHQFSTDAREFQTSSTVDALSASVLSAESSLPEQLKLLQSDVQRPDLKLDSQGAGPELTSDDAKAFAESDEVVELTLGDEPSGKLEITPEARAMFHHVYHEILALVGGEHNLAPPKEIVWLNGAPGAGKGANTPFILQTRGFEARAIQVSDLLSGNREVSSIMQSGGLVSDSMVLRLVLERILNLGSTHVAHQDGDHLFDDDGPHEEVVAGAVVDGFPRTTLQVDFIKLLHDQLMLLHHKYQHTPLEHKFPRPIFRIAVLYVEEEESIRRQLGRGRAAIAHNQRVADSGIGDMVEVRPTDLCGNSARRRYKIFKKHYDTLLRLKAFFPFHLIDGMGTLAECREQIEKELQYQSALELDATTFRAISHIPLARDLAKQARQAMVARLDGYQAHEADLFKKVIDIISTDVMPLVRRSALAGIAFFHTENPIFSSAPVAAEMLADILSERGYSVTWHTKTREIPLRVDPTTNNIICSRRSTLQFQIRFERPQLRNTVAAMGPTQSMFLLPKPITAEQMSKEERSASVCQSMRADGTPGCFVKGGDGASMCAMDPLDSACEEVPGDDGEEKGVAIPGLPDNGRIVRPRQCPPLPSWAVGDKSATENSK